MILLDMQAKSLQWAPSPGLRVGVETSSLSQLAAVNLPGGASVNSLKARGLFVVKAMEVEGSRTASLNRHAESSDKNGSLLSSVGNSTNIKWHECSLNKTDRQELLKQKGCVIWITGLSGSGKSTVACALGGSLYRRGKLSYSLDGDNVRHGLNHDLSFKADDRAENIRRIAWFLLTEGIVMPAVQCYLLETSLRCLWTFHSKFVRLETRKAYISLHVQGKSKVLLGLMIHMSNR
ncbi:adenylyl-sulfate kinase 3-like [Pyrus ussuriensis x Pyrus communis]|uniref:Adenylyl-sulfate kinase 3-like n=1 Tax=Pyrus ussuriensis x Pyrus communis TaxID=2448454 RepID=A0A5N5I8A6_9ROSA|nr:adenylyl-sulfate kinase 3-like [Pyrus ussuriensis x Pyrus communis]